MSNGDNQPVTGPDGKLYQFPTGTTKDQAVAYFKKKGIGVSQALPKSPTAMSASPGGARGWLQNVEGDVRSGSDVTAIGKLLKMMGAQGLQQGSQAGAGEFMGSPVLGSLHAAQGVSDIPSKGLKTGGLEALSGIGEAGTIPQLMFGGELTNAPKTLASMGNILKEGFSAGKESLAAYRTGKKAAKSLSEMKKINQVLGVGQKAIRISEGTGSLEEAATMPGRTLERLGFKAKELEKMEPIERMKVLQPFLKEAGQNIQNALITAGNEGKTVDIWKSANQLIEKLPKEDQQKARDVFTTLVDELEIVDENKASPLEAWKLQKELSHKANFDARGRWSSLGAIRAELERAVGTDIKSSVPEMKELNQIYSDLKESSKAARAGVQKESVSPKPGMLKIMKEAAKKEFAEKPIRSLGVAAGVPSLGYVAGREIFGK